MSYIEIKKINDVLERSVIIEKIAEFIGVDTIILDKIAKKGLVDEQYSKTFILVSFPAGKSVEQLEQMIDKVNEIAQNT